MRDVSDMGQLLAYYLYSHRTTRSFTPYREDWGKHDLAWAVPRFADGQRDERPDVSDEADNVGTRGASSIDRYEGDSGSPPGPKTTLDGSATSSHHIDGASRRTQRLRRYLLPPGAFAYGAMHPTYALAPPRFALFNLCEPFGRGNVVSDVPISPSKEAIQQIQARRVNNHTPWPTWVSYGYVMVPSDHKHVFELDETIPLRGYRVRWGGDGNCTPYLSRLKPHPADALWGWHHYAWQEVEGHKAQEVSRAHETRGERAHAANHSQSRTRRFFRPWAFHFQGKLKFTVMHTFLAGSNRNENTSSCGSAERSVYSGIDFKKCCK